MTALELASVLQARMPSYHVWSSLPLPVLPHFPNQEPLRPQQLIFPGLAKMPHLGHTELMVVVVAVGVYVVIGQSTKKKTRKQSLLGLREDLST